MYNKNYLYVNIYNIYLYIYMEIHVYIYERFGLD